MADSPLLPVVSQWLEKIHSAMAYKARRFGKDAEEGMRFFTGPYDWLYAGGRTGKRDADENAPAATFQMTLNKTAELVQIFGPVLYHKNPTRQVTPRKPPAVPPEAFGPVVADPTAAMAYQQFLAGQQQQRAADETRAALLEGYLNLTPTTLDLKTHSRWAIDEALIKGLGLLWAEPYRPAGSPFTLVGSFYDSVDNLVIDPDLESLQHAQWVARRCVHPVWWVEREYGLPPGTLRGTLESYNQAASVAADTLGDYRRAQGATNDLLVYWKVYSKMGAGGRLRGVAPHVRGPLDQFGDYCHLVVTEGANFPLNLPPALTDAGGVGGADAVAAALQWPTPYWAVDAWPFAKISFHDVPRDVWPMSHLAPGFGELKFLNWLYSFIAGKVKTTCRDFLVLPKDMDEEVKAAIRSGKDLTLLELEREHAEAFAKIVQFLQHPGMNGDILRVADQIAHNFEQRTGLTELMYGESGRQLRSAAEAEIKHGQLNVRPDDMSNKVEDAMSEAARLEAFAARWHLTGADIAPVFGPAVAAAWDRTVTAADPGALVNQLEYRIEAGSTRKPNRERDAANMKDAIQFLFQPLFQVAAQTGNAGPVNALIADWAKSLDIDPEPYLIALPPPPPAAPAGDPNSPVPSGSV